MSEELGLGRAGAYLCDGWREHLTAQGAHLAVQGQGTGGDIEVEQLQLLQPARDAACVPVTALGQQRTKA